MAINGLMAHAKPYPLMIDTRIDSSAQAMIADLQHGDIDCGILWGPMAGYYAKQATPPLMVTSLVKETMGPPLIYRIGMAVRPSDQEFKRTLDKLIADNQTGDQQAADRLRPSAARRGRRADHVGYAVQTTMIGRASQRRLDNPRP